MEKAAVWSLKKIKQSYFQNVKFGLRYNYEWFCHDIHQFRADDPVYFDAFQ